MILLSFFLCNAEKCTPSPERKQIWTRFFICKSLYVYVFFVIDDDIQENIALF